MKIDFEIYKRQYRLSGVQSGIDEEQIDCLIDYARCLNENNIPIVFDQQHLALLLGMDYSYLLGITNNQTGCYKEYRIPKRKGGFRTIMEPLPTLKYIQTWILHEVLYPLLKTHVARQATAYVPGKGIRDNVKFHKGKETVMRLDIKDFFDSIGFFHVLDIFLGLGYEKSVAVMFANLCTVRCSLPQGAPTSPMLSNMILKPFDETIFNYCKSRKIMYTRYADDMTFSGSFDRFKLTLLVTQLISKIGLKLNYSKTVVKRRWQRQTVTNIVVNQKIQTRRDYRRKIRQSVFYIKKYGLINQTEHYNKKKGTCLSADSFLMHVMGQVNYALQINPKDKEMAEYRRVLFDLKKQ